MKRVAIYNPYLDTLGGGERYVMTVANVLKSAGWHVELQWKDKKILKWLGERLGIDLEGVEVVPDISKGAGYDLVFWLSDGSIPLLFGNKNILHFQTPFTNVGGKNIANRLKLLKIHLVICNSLFTKSVIDREYGLNSTVIYPPVSIEEFKAQKKENIILSVGRFSSLQQAKRQDVLIDVFKRMCKRDLKGWELILIGGSDVGAGDFVEQLKKEAKGYPIKILENLPFDQIKRFYGKSKIFWSGAGFNIDEGKEPHKVEHFGITTVEAMASGCVPVVVNKGGHKETVKDQVNGFLWNDLSQLHEITVNLTKDEKLRAKIASEGVRAAKEFSIKNFEEKFLSLI